MTDQPQVPSVPGEPPPDAPSAIAVDNLRLWKELVDASAANVVASAEKWRLGLAALITLLTGGLVIAGPDFDHRDSTYWAIASGLMVAGLTCAGIGFLIALIVAAGRPARSNLLAIENQYGSVRIWLLQRAITQVKAILAVEILAGATLLLIVGGSAVWLLSPAPEASPVTEIDLAGDTVCGKLQSADGQTFVIKADGESAVRRIPFENVTNIRTLDACE